jgi:hypothetical protein
MKLLLTVVAAALLICSFYMIGGWAQHEIDHMEWRND